MRNRLPSPVHRDRRTTPGACHCGLAPPGGCTLLPEPRVFADGCTTLAAASGASHLAAGSGIGCLAATQRSCDYRRLPSCYGCDFLQSWLLGHAHQCPGVCGRHGGAADVQSGAWAVGLLPTVSPWGVHPLCHRWRAARPSASLQTSCWWAVSMADVRWARRQWPIFCRALGRAGMGPAASLPRGRTPGRDLPVRWHRVIWRELY